jgi:hypothetical protein
LKWNLPVLPFFRTNFPATNVSLPY